MEKKLNTQINKLLEVQKRLKQKPLSLNELKQIAISSGIPEFEWNEMLQIAEKNTSLAKEHMQFGNYYDAFETASEAATINPYLTEAMLIASDAALKIYLDDEKIEYLEKAEYYAREILKLSPSESQAVKILASIENYERKGKDDKKRKIYTYVSIGIVILLIIIASVYFINNKPAKKVNSKTKKELIIAQEDAKSQWAQVENVISRRDNLIPEIMILVDDNKDPKIIELTEEINKLKIDLKTASEEQKIIIQAELQKKISKLTAFIKKNNNSKQVELLMVQIEGTYNRIGVETRRYNEKVKQYNILLKQNSEDFPDFEEMYYYNQK